MNFVSEVFSESGQPSFSRVASGVFVLVVLFLVAYLTLKDGKLPDLAGITLFTTGTVGILYGSNKIASAVETGLTGKRETK